MVEEQKTVRLSVEGSMSVMKWMFSAHEPNRPREEEQRIRKRFPLVELAHELELEVGSWEEGQKCQEPVLVGERKPGSDPQQ